MQHYKQKYENLSKKNLLERIPWEYNIAEYLSDSVKDDKDIALELVKANGRSLNFLPKLNEDKEIVMAAIKQNASALQFAGPEMKDDEDVVRESLDRSYYTYNETSFCYASERLRNDVNMCLYALDKWVFNLKYVCNDELKEDIELIKKLVKKDPTCYQYASNKLKDNLEMAFFAVQVNGIALFSVSARLLDNETLIREALLTKPNVITLIPENERYKYTSVPGSAPASV